MPTCDTCGNDYADTFTVRINGSTHQFDSFECAIQALAPSCAKCGVRVLGHGVEGDGKIFCGAHCAHGAGLTEATDHV